MIRKERTAHFRSVIDKQKESGLCGAAFCQEEKIPLHQFYRWRRRFHQPERGHRHFSVPRGDGDAGELLSFWVEEECRF